jgi:hypothetical protein
VFSPAQKLDPEAGFQSMQMVRDGGLGHPEPMPGSGEGFLFDHRDENAQTL